MSKSKTEELAGWIMKAALAAVIAAVCWLLRSALIYIATAFVTALIGKQVMRILKKIRIKGSSIPNGILATFTLILIFAVAGLFVYQVIPIVSSLVHEASSVSRLVHTHSLDGLNQWLTEMFPSLGPDFDIIDTAMAEITNLLNTSNVPSAITKVIGSASSAVSSFFVGLFATVFIAFFFIKDEYLFQNIVGSLVPDDMEDKVRSTIDNVENLLSRYFLGIVAESTCIFLLDSLGLFAIARLNFGPAVGIAFIAGILNVIPYLGPFIGIIFGIVMGILMKLGTGVGLDVGIPAFAAIIFAIMFAVQLIDNYVLQPVIYSSSLHTHPLEIFLVLVVAGSLAGPLGMLLSIPAYTVLRVIAGHFLPEWKPVKRLLGTGRAVTTENENPK